MKGTCLCGSVVFSLVQTLGPFELCHCRRCQKYSGSAYAAFLTARVKGYQVLSGRELMRSYAAPLINAPPAYTVWFCSNCGSPVPDPAPQGEIFEIPAGSLDHPAETPKPDKHIFVDLKSDWEPLDEQPPRFTKKEIRAFRAKHGRVAILPSGKAAPGSAKES